MDFRTYIDQYLSERGDEDPLFATTEDGQSLLRVSREQDLESRMSDIPDSGAEPSEEITEVDELARDALSLASTPEPLQDVATITPEEIGPQAEVSPSLTPDAEPVSSPPAATRVSSESADLPIEPAGVQSAESEPAVPSDLRQETSVAETPEPELQSSAIVEQAVPEELVNADGERADGQVPESDDTEAAVPTELRHENTPSAEPRLPESDTTQEAVPNEILSESTEPASPHTLSAESGEVAIPQEFVADQTELATEALVPDSADSAESAIPAELRSESGEAATPASQERQSGAEAVPDTVPQSDTERALAAEIPQALLFATDPAEPAEVRQEDTPQASPAPLFQTDGERARQTTLLTPPGKEAEFGELLIRAEETFNQVTDHRKKVFETSFNSGVELPPLIPIPERVLNGDDPSFKIFSGLRDWVRQ